MSSVHAFRCKYVRRNPKWCHDDESEIERVFLIDGINEDSETFKSSQSQASRRDIAWLDWTRTRAEHESNPASQWALRSKDSNTTLLLHYVSSAVRHWYLAGCAPTSLRARARAWALVSVVPLIADSLAKRCTAYASAHSHLLCEHVCSLVHARSLVHVHALALAYSSIKTHYLKYMQL